MDKWFIDRWCHNQSHNRITIIGNNKREKLFWEFKESLSIFLNKNIKKLIKKNSIHKPDLDSEVDYV